MSGKKNGTVGPHHGKYGTRVYSIWSNMLSRCENPSVPKFKDYGARGITVCAAWHDFRRFYADMGDPPEGMTLERVDVDGNYEPGNCKWATLVEQANNKRSAIVVDGERMSKREAGRRLGLSSSTVNQRLRYGWTIEQAVSTPKGGVL